MYSWSAISRAQPPATGVPSVAACASSAAPAFPPSLRRRVREGFSTRSPPNSAPWMRTDGFRPPSAFGSSCASGSSPAGSCSGVGASGS